MRETETSAPSLGDWVMVPREPTIEQLCAGAKAWGADPMRRSSTLYRAMVEAAAPPTAMAEAVASARAEAIEEFGASTEDELDERIARQGARENMRLIDSISDLIGQPHDVELTKSDVANALASARAEGVKEGLERAAKEAKASEAVAELRKHWDAFCDADPVPEDFVERMDAAGLATIRKVTKHDLEASFASERGIYKGGEIWVLTDAGHEALKAAPPTLIPGGSSDV